MKVSVYLSVPQVGGVSPSWLAVSVRQTTSMCTACTVLGCSHISPQTACTHASTHIDNSIQQALSMVSLCDKAGLCHSSVNRCNSDRQQSSGKSYCITAASQEQSRSESIEFCCAEIDRSLYQRETRRCPRICSTCNTHCLMLSRLRYSRSTTELRRSRRSIYVRA